MKLCIGTNVEGSFNVLRLASNAKKPIVIGSSREVFGNAKDLPVKAEV
jgi:nucleoside-diphosphate-sugar epimerase